MPRLPTARRRACRRRIAPATGRNAASTAASTSSIAVGSSGSTDSAQRGQPVVAEHVERMPRATPDRVGVVGTSSRVDVIEPRRRASDGHRAEAAVDPHDRAGHEARTPASEASQTTAPTSSSGSPSRPAGVCATIARRAVLGQQPLILFGGEEARRRSRSRLPMWRRGGGPGRRAPARRSSPPTCWTSPRCARCWPRTRRSGRCGRRWSAR